MVKNHYSGKVVKRYYVVTEKRVTTFINAKNANDLFQKLKNRGWHVKLKTSRVDLGKEYKEGTDTDGYG